MVFEGDQTFVIQETSPKSSSRLAIGQVFCAKRSFFACAAKVRSDGPRCSIRDKMRRAAKGRPLERPFGLDFNCFSDRQGILEFNTQGSDCAVHFGMTKQKLNSAQVAWFLVDLSDLRSPHRMGAVSARL